MMALISWLISPEEVTVPSNAIFQSIYISTSLLDWIQITSHLSDSLLLQLWKRLKLQWCPN